MVNLSVERIVDNVVSVAFVVVSEVFALVKTFAVITPVVVANSKIVGLTFNVFVISCWFNCTGSVVVDTVGSPEIFFVTALVFNFTACVELS